MAESTDFQRRFQAALKALDKKQSEVARQAESEEDDGVLVGVESAPVDSDKKEAQVRPPTGINLFQHPDAHPVVLDLALMRKYDLEWMEWEPETLEWQIPQDFRTSEVSLLNMGKIQAMKTMHYNDTFWQRWEVFNWCTAALNNLHADFEVMQVPSTAQVMVAVDIAGHVRTDVEWTDEVKEFIRTACRFDGIFCPPDPLGFIEVGTVHGLVDCEDIRNKWPLVRRLDKAPAADTIVDEQLRRNLDAHRFLLASRQRMKDQLPLVLNA